MRRVKMYFYKLRARVPLFNTTPIVTLKLGLLDDYLG